MVERETIQFNTPFHDLILEQLEGKEIAGKNIGVIAIAGTIGSGSSSTSHELLSLAGQEFSVPTRFFSSGDEMRKIYTDTTGRRNMEGHFNRNSNIDRMVDKGLGLHMIDLTTQNSLVIAEGRLAPYVARNLQLASLDLGISLPSEMVTVFMTAEENIRYYRKFLQAKKEDPRITEEECYEGLNERRNGEINAFWAAYPDLKGINPYNVNFQIRKRPVYDLVYDTSSHEAVDIALDIIANEKVRKMLSAAGISE
jgi:cytidylate kinase